MIDYFLDFEQEIALLEGKINELKHLNDGKGINIVDEISKLQFKANSILKEKYANLTPWQRVKVARHPDRPHFIDYLENIFNDFHSLSGDRVFGEDEAVIGGLASINKTSVVVIGQEKGSDTNSRIKRNFGMVSPEGYRKCSRLMSIAEKFKLPLVTFIDTAGAYPGVGAEERGQAEAIARSIQSCLSVNVPIIGVIIGEGGSGGAMALAATDKLIMLENSIYSVISPEGCASILWRTDEYAEQASNALNLTAVDLEKLKVVDKIIKEPLGGAHRDKEKAINSVKVEIIKYLENYTSNSFKDLRYKRREKFLNFGSSIIA